MAKILQSDATRQSEKEAMDMSLSANKKSPGPRKSKIKQIEAPQQ